MSNGSTTCGARERLMPEECDPVILVGGQISADEHSKTIGAGDIVVRTRNVFQNIRRAPNQGGADLKHIIKFNTFYAYEGDGDEVREYWEEDDEDSARFLSDQGRVGTVIRVSGFTFPDLLIEIVAIAYVPELVSSIEE